MEEDTEYTKLPLEERCVHKLWKARVHGYEEATKVFRLIPDEKSPEWNKYLGLVKKFVVDSNAAAQEKGLEAVLAYVEGAGPAGKTVGEVMSGLVTKCLAAPKAKTKELALQLILMYVEIEKQEAVVEELLKGMEQKNPKVVAACIVATTSALREFGSKVVNVKPLVKKIPSLLEDRDKTVRDEGKAMIVEVYRWVGVAVKPQLNNLKPVQLTELEAEFEKVQNERAVPTRYLRSQQQRQLKEQDVVDAQEDDGEEEEEGPEPIDPFDLMTPVDILSKLSKDFYEKLESKKWQERKESMDELDVLLKNPKLENGEYGDLVRALKKIIAKDSNVVIVASASKSLASLANGLKKKFQPYALSCVSVVLEKFREKKQTVVTALRDAIDAISFNLTLESMLEDVTAALENKNPAMKAETASFLARFFTKCTPQALDRKMLKTYTPLLLKTLNESDPIVRDNSAEALGTAMKVVGEKAIMAFLGDVENLKIVKIKECCEKAVITAKVPKTRPTTAPAKMAGTGEKSSAPTAGKPVRRPGASAPPKKAPPKKAGASSAAGASGKGKVSKKQAASVSNLEKELSDEEVDEKALEILPPDVLSGLADSNWKTRLAAAEQFLQAVNTMERAEIQTQVLVRILNKKPGLKDGNFQVLKAKLDVIKALAENSTFSRTTAQFCLQDVADKLGDAKNGTLASETLTAIAEATKLDFVATEVVVFAFNQKSPKLQQESMNWLSNAIREFGFVVQPKPLIENVRKALSATNVSVRTAGISLLGTMFLYMGNSLRPLVDSEKPSLLQQINTEFEKYEGERPPMPTRGQAVSSSEDPSEEADDDDLGPDPGNLQALLPRADISAQITETMLSELVDKNWKVRDEALQRLSSILSNNQYVTANLGELPPVLAARLQDSNKNIGLTSFTICKKLGVAMGTLSKQHLRTFLPGMLQGLGDSKNTIRVMAMECMKVWAEQCGVKDFFEGEVIADALKSGNPFLKTELFLWLSESLPEAKGINKEELVACMPYLLASVEDRSAEVRKNAQDAIMPFMIHLGYVTMTKHLAKLSASSRTTVSMLFDKARSNMPAKPAPKDKQEAQPKSVMGRGKAAGAKPTACTSKSKVGAGSTKAAPGGRSRKDEDVDTSPFLQANNMKNQRVVDEQKLRVLKWNFTTPREEFVDLLKEQMTTAGVNKNLMFNMFHSDFKFHLKAIDTLNESLNANAAATVSNLDLILKWLTLRFFDTNPSVLLRGLEYLQGVFNMLADEGYNMLETEASSFIPYLLLKAGDPKDTVRNSVRAILDLITSVYSCSKLFTYVMEGLKSKNSRQRTECLEELAHLIEKYAISVCQPSPPAALKEIARQISDRDNSVRTAALNCVVQAWYQEGERVYKMIGQISDKDLSLLQERIKRAGKNRPVIRSAPEMARNSKAVRPLSVQEQPCHLADRGQDLEEEEETHFSPRDKRSQSPGRSETCSTTSRTSSRNSVNGNHLNETFNMDDDEACSRRFEKDFAEPRRPSPGNRARPISGKFRLDYDMLHELENRDASLRVPQLVEMDLDELVSSDVKLPNMDAPKHSTVSSPGASGFSMASAELCVGRLCNHRLERSVEACQEVEEMLRRESALRVLQPLMDQLLVAITMQLRILHKAAQDTHDLQMMSNNYTLLITILRQLFSMPEMARRASQLVIIDLMGSLLLMLVEQKLERFPQEDQITRLTNSLVVRIIENSEHTALVTAQLRMLHECIADPNTHPKFTELVMKSLWKVMRVINDWENSLDFAAVLRQINVFFTDFPSHTWRDRSNQVPLKTVKTLVHTMVQMQGTGLLTYLNKEETCNELTKIINKYISMSAKTGEKIQSNAKETMSPHRLSKITHQQLSGIFKKIGSKDQTKEGLEQLYDFQIMHPDADIAPFIEKASQFFQDYIEKGLRGIEKERKKQSSTTASTLSSPQVFMDTPSESGSESGLYPRAQQGEEPGHLEEGDDEDGKAQYFKDRLKALQNMAGLEKKVSSSNGGVPVTTTDNRANDVNRNHRLDENLEPIPRSTSTETMVVNNSEMEQILQRLERFKSSAR